MWLVNEIGEIGAEAIGYALKRNKTLKSLDLGSNIQYSNIL